MRAETTFTSAGDSSVSLTEAADALLRLLCKDVTLKGLGTHNLTGTGATEALCGSFVRLHLRHDLVLLLIVPCIALALLSLSCLVLLIKSALDRCNEHVHVASLHLGLALNGGIRLEILSKTLEDIESLLGVGHLTTAEHDRNLYASAFLEKAHDVIFLSLVIAHIDLRTEFHFP